MKKKIECTEELSGVAITDGFLVVKFACLGCDNTDIKGFSLNPHPCSNKFLVGEIQVAEDATSFVLAKEYQGTKISKGKTKISIDKGILTIRIPTEKVESDYSSEFELG